MNKKFVIANWKMNGSFGFVTSFMKGFIDAVRCDLYKHAKFILIPSFVYLDCVNKFLTNAEDKFGVELGAQDLSYDLSYDLSVATGAHTVAHTVAHTGDVSGSMLIDVGCKYVLIGHSERRVNHFESLDCVAQKFCAAISCGLVPIICVGESFKERDSSQTKDVLHKQITTAFLKGLHLKLDVSQSIIAYEPLWAIGSGCAADINDIVFVHKAIRDILGSIKFDLVNRVKVIYGGSLNAENAECILGSNEVDGGLIGGASLSFEKFLKIGSKACAFKE